MKEKIQLTPYFISNELNFLNAYTRKALNKFSKNEKNFNTKDCFKDMFHILTEPKTIFDVGAWEGNTTEKFLSFFPNSEFFCFEPNHKGYKQLEKKFKDLENVHTFELAISDKEGVQDLFQFDNSPINSLMPFKKNTERYINSEIKFLGKSEVTVTTLDKFCEEQKIASIDLLKMDIQGSEIKLITGAENLLKKKKVNLIFSELIFINLYENQGKYFEIQSMLDKFGYLVFDFYNFVYDKNGQLKWGDAIFLPSYS